MDRTYIAIDLKSFYASVECVERGLDPMTTNLVVADESRTEKTICLAVSPSLKAYGISGRARLFEVVLRVKEVNRQRQLRAPGRQFIGTSVDDRELKQAPELAVGYIVAPPRMAHYIKHSAEIYNIYLKYVAPEDIHVYSIDEVFMDVTPYLGTYQLTARQLTQKIIRDVQQTTGITATAGIGSNLYLCKVALDIVAKHISADESGARIAELDEKSYRQQLWNHRPLTDFWRVGRGYAKKLEAHGLYTMGNIAQCSSGAASDYYNEELLYRLFGVNAELLIDHAWGWEPCTISEIKSYRPKENSIVSGQVLQSPCSAEEAKLVAREMVDLLALDLVEKGLVTNQLTLTIGYDVTNLSDPERKKAYHGPVTTDFYGRSVPRHAHGTANLGRFTASGRALTEAILGLYEEIVNRKLLVRRVTISANHLIARDADRSRDFEQLDLFGETEATRRLEAIEEKEQKMQETILKIKKKYGKNAVLKGMNLQEGATAVDRNQQIGGHKA